MSVRIIELSKDLKSDGYYVTMYVEDGKLIMKMQNNSNNKITNTEITMEDLNSDNENVKTKLKDKVK